MGFVATRSSVTVGQSYRFAVEGHVANGLGLACLQCPSTGLLAGGSCALGMCWVSSQAAKFLGKASNFSL